MKTLNLFHLSFIKVSLLALILVFTIFSCKTRQKEDEQDSEEVTDISKLKEEIIEELTGYPLPTSFEITKLLNEAGAPYILSISNPVDNVDSYFTQKSRGLNLGVYGADLSYSSTYRMKQETMLYLKAASQLINELEITSAFNISFADRVENNLDDQDSLIQIITSSFYDTYEYLNKNNQDKLSILVLAGSWIEGLYITTQITIVAEKSEKIVDLVARQKISLNKLIEIMEPVKDDQNISELLNDLGNLKTIYGGVDEKLTEEQLNDITKTIEAIRNKIIE